MESTIEVFALTFTGLALALALLALIIFVKEWTQHKARQIWPDQSSFSGFHPLDVEANFALESDVSELLARVTKLEAAVVRENVAQYRD